METADQLKNAIESAGGVSGVRATLCDKLDIPKSAPVKWDGVSPVSYTHLTLPTIYSV